MNRVNHTLYKIFFKDGTCLEHIDVFDLKFDDVIGSLMLLNGKRREDIKEVFVTYGYEPLRNK